jgi:hypothetical protein
MGHHPQLQELLRMAISKYSSLENDMTGKTMEKRQCKNNSIKITIFLHGTLWKFLSSFRKNAST